MVRYGKAMSAVVANVSPKNATTLSDIDMTIFLLESLPEFAYNDSCRVAVTELTSDPITGNACQALGETILVALGRTSKSCKPFGYRGNELAPRQTR